MSRKAATPSRNELPSAGDGVPLDAVDGRVGSVGFLGLDADALGRRCQSTPLPRRAAPVESCNRTGESMLTHDDTSLHRVTCILDKADGAPEGLTFLWLVKKAVKAILAAHREQEAGCDEAFVTVRDRLHGWLDEPPARVDSAYAAFAFCDSLRDCGFTGGRYPILDHDCYPGLQTWVEKDVARLWAIADDERSTPPGLVRSPADVACEVLVTLPAADRLED
jgi:hypothetical protein